MKRKIPLFKVSVKPGANYSQLSDIPEVQNAVINETIYAIKYGILKNKKSIPLFEVANSQYYVELEKDKWKPSLENAISYFLNREEYEKCNECKSLISQLTPKSISYVTESAGRTCSRN